jgi:hypothetical protein
VGHSPDSPCQANFDHRYKIEGVAGRGGLHTTSSTSLSMWQYCSAVQLELEWCPIQNDLACALRGVCTFTFH